MSLSPKSKAFLIGVAGGFLLTILLTRNLSKRQAEPLMEVAKNTNSECNDSVKEGFNESVHIVPVVEVSNESVVQNAVIEPEIETTVEKEIAVDTLEQVTSNITLEKVEEVDFITGFLADEEMSNYYFNGQFMLKPAKKESDKVPVVVAEVVEQPLSINEDSVTADSNSIPKVEIPLPTNIEGDEIVETSTETISEVAEVNESTIFESEPLKEINDSTIGDTVADVSDSTEVSELEVDEHVSAVNETKEEIVEYDSAVTEVREIVVVSTETIEQEVVLTEKVDIIEETVDASAKDQAAEKAVDEVEIAEEAVGASAAVPEQSVGVEITANESEDIAEHISKSSEVDVVHENFEAENPQGAVLETEKVESPQEAVLEAEQVESSQEVAETILRAVVEEVVQVEIQDQETPAAEVEDQVGEESVEQDFKPEPLPVISEIPEIAETEPEALPNSLKTSLNVNAFEFVPKSYTTEDMPQHSEFFPSKHSKHPNHKIPKPKKKLRKTQSFSHESSATLFDFINPKAESKKSKPIKCIFGQSCANKGKGCVYEH